MFKVHGAMEGKHWWFVVRAHITRQVLREIVGDGDKKLIVDIGCGTGGMVNFLADDFWSLGHDLSETAISEAKKLYPDRSFKFGNVHAHIDAIKNETSVFFVDGCP